jgi:hypothetical protein
MELTRKRPAETRLVLLLLVAIGWFYAWTVAPEGLPGINLHSIPDSVKALLAAWLGFAASVALLCEVRTRYFARASTAALLVGVLALGLALGVPSVLRRGGPDELRIALAYACLMIAFWALARGMRRPIRIGWLVIAFGGIFAVVIIHPHPGFGADRYWFEPARWSHYFPYVLPIAPGSVGAVRREVEDLLPGVAFAAGLGIMGWCARAEPGRSARGLGASAGGAAAGAALLYCSGFGVLVSLRSEERLRAEHPALYQRLVHWASTPDALIDRWRQVDYGPVELKVVFPQAAEGANEALVVTGRGARADYLFVHYAGPEAVQFGFEHADRALLLSDPVRLQPGTAHTVRIDLGSLYPPIGHPYFDRLDPLQVRLRPTTLAVAVDGEVVLHQPAEFYDAVSADPSIGSAPGRPVYLHPFSGQIAAERRVPDATISPLAAAGGASGPLRLELTFPAFGLVRSEPLLSTGVSGRGDLVYVSYLGPRTVAFGYDHWSRGGPVSANLTIDPAAVQTVEIDTSAINPKNPGRLRLSLNGRPVFDLPEPAYSCSADTVAIGMNGIGASTATDRFTGRILQAQRLDQ